MRPYILHRYQYGDIPFNHNGVDYVIKETGRVWHVTSGLPLRSQENVVLYARAAFEVERREWLNGKIYCARCWWLGLFIVIMASVSITWWCL